MKEQKLIVGKLDMQAFHQCNIFINEQKVSDINCLYKLAQHVTYSVHMPSLSLLLNSVTYINKGKSSQFWYDLFDFDNPINTVLNTLLFITGLLIQGVPGGMCQTSGECSLC